MSWQTLPFLDVFRDATGGNIKTKQSEYLPTGAYPIVDQGKAMVGGYTDDGAALCKSAEPVIVFGDHTKALKYVDFPFCLGADGTKVLVPKVEADLKFLFYALHTIDIPEAGYSRHFKFLKRGEIPLPPLEEQRRIAGILDAADALRRRRREALALLDTLPGAIFAEMFGDDPYSFEGMENANVADVVSLISDGPFGSNLKSSHYVEDGVRVARLQNIGIGEFNDSDQAFISPEHAKKLSRNNCFPGDVLVATLGDPNVRACVVPEYIPELINKADVVRIIPDEKKVLSKFLVCLLNLPVTQSQIQSLVLGQTRGRVSMGRLKTLRIPTPPTVEQRAFVDRIEVLEGHRTALRNHLSELETLFASLQSRAFFAGEL